jgi:hypothetical protein
MKKILVFGLFLSLLSSVGFAQPPAAPVVDSPAQFASLLASNISQLLQNIDLMKKQILSLVEENDRLKADAAKAANTPAQSKQ